MAGRRTGERNFGKSPRVDVERNASKMRQMRQSERKKKKEMAYAFIR